jgi:hypothetical protein
MPELSKENRIYVTCQIAKINQAIEKLQMQGVDIIDCNNPNSKLNSIIQKEAGEAYFTTEAV